MSILSPKPKYYSLDRILKYNADYNIIYGERSNGKTTAILRYALERHIESGYTSQLAIIRRWDEDFRGKNGKQMYDAIVSLGWIEDLTNGKYNNVYYQAKRWYLIRYSETGEKEEVATEPFAMGFSINSQEHYKSTSYPNVNVILFDEFITRSQYLINEFIEFQNLLSTIIRLRTDVIIFMCGNSVNKYCPYFNEMGISNIKKQQQGTIDIYTYGESDLKVAVEYTKPMGEKSKKSNKYFAFNNPRLQMIRDGGWEIDIYPHMPYRILPKEIGFIFYLVFDKDILQGEVIKHKDDKFVFFHRKTTPLKDDNTRLVYDTNINVKRNYRTRIDKPFSNMEKIIYQLFALDKVFYQDNEVGEIVHNYLLWCQNARLKS